MNASVNESTVAIVSEKSSVTPDMASTIHVYTGATTCGFINATIVHAALKSSAVSPVTSDQGRGLRLRKTTIPEYTMPRKTTKRRMMFAAAKSPSASTFSNIVHPNTARASKKETPLVMVEDRLITVDVMELMASRGPVKSHANSTVNGQSGHSCTSLEHVPAPRSTGGARQNKAGEHDVGGCGGGWRDLVNFVRHGEVGKRARNKRVNAPDE
eukprot:3390050-Rhodomonas_salina.3